MRQLLMVTLLLMMSTTGCKISDPIIPNEEEVITTLRFTLTPLSGGPSVILEFKDIDGDGGNLPVFAEAPLNANTNYLGRLELLNEQESPVDDITKEIEEEDEAHQFFFKPSNGLHMSIDYNDKDLSGRPIGLMTKVATGDASSGTLKITLRHGPNKSAPGAQDGLIDLAGGETDIEIEFTIHVQ